MSIDFASIPWGTFLVVGILIGIAIGWGIGFADSNMRTKKKIEAAEANAEIAISEAEKKIAVANQKIAEIPAQPQVMVQDDPGFLRLKNNSGYFALEIDGAPVNSALSPDGKKRLIELLTVIRPYLEGGIPPQAPPMPAAPRPSFVSAQNAPVKPAPVVQPAAPPPVQIPTPVETDESPKPVVKTIDKKAMAALSMVGQIDAVLQERLMNSPLAKRGIRVAESPEGGVRVEVGMERFEAVDDVTDPEVKAFIRASIAEWEKKFTPGL